MSAACAPQASHDFPCFRITKDRQGLILLRLAKFIPMDLLRMNNSPFEFILTLCTYNAKSGIILHACRTDAALWCPFALARGTPVRVLWPKEGRFFQGKVVKYLAASFQHEVHYDDGACFRV